MSDPRLRAVFRKDLKVFVEKCFTTLEPGAYQPNWHIQHICWQLERVARGDVRRLIINVPPRSMKSITVSVAFSAWLMGRDPTKKIIAVSYAEELARKLASDAKTVMQTNWFGTTFPRFGFAGRPRTLKLETTLKGHRLARGMCGSILGEGADLILVDDPIKATDALSEASRRSVNEAFDNTLRTRLNNKVEGAIVIIMQRLHEDDLVGHVLKSEDWEVVAIPAIAPEDQTYQLSDDPGDVYVRKANEVLHPEREPLEELETLRRAQGSLTFSSQYQQQPLPLEGNIVKREWMRSYVEAPEEFDLVIASWDTASTLSETADWSVGTVWGAKGLDFYLLDCLRVRSEVPELRRQIVALAERWDVDQTVVEEGDMGRAIVQDLRRTRHRNFIMQKVRIEKQARFLAQSARFESGQVHVPVKAPWYADWLNELLAFPNGKHDDQVDSTSQALAYLTDRTKTLNPVHKLENGRQRPSPPRPKGRCFRSLRA
ncbi:phage terminase large subunit [Chenggangzhangella methanolivorans]|uniref:Phage terminase large subunit n=1 Tax=Chenggangzhangella methanolivorans TaxID=1437009 RepID=A0A9E6RBD8_9HYPH|nr:phage terminase large subunit [Chenggangzhangella methanolivorans]QZO01255.1 phage terminase large subunit [Chenggangzhangella methanolivorans]